MKARKDQGIITELDQESKRQENAFLKHIANQLGRPRIQSQPQRTEIGAPEFWKNYYLEKEERIHLFMKNWQSLDGIAKRFSALQEIPTYIAQILTEIKAQKIIRWNHPLFEAMELDKKLEDIKTIIWDKRNNSHLLAETANADCGIVVADYAIAHTGTIVVTSAPTQGRSVSLLPNVLVTIIPAKNIQTRMGEVFSKIQHRYTQLPAGIHFITGPSRSADIENDLTIGVHGPGIVYALIIDDKV